MFKVLLFLTFSTVLIYLQVYHLREKPKIYFKSTEKNKNLVEKLNPEDYHANIVGINSFLHTIFVNIFRKGPEQQYERYFIC